MNPPKTASKELRVAQRARLERLRRVVEIGRRATDAAERRDLESVGVPDCGVEAAWLVKVHTGYDEDEQDHHDVHLPCVHLGVRTKDEYVKFPG
jgi:hypothetical protein